MSHFVLVDCQLLAPVFWLVFHLVHQRKEEFPLLCTCILLLTNALPYHEKLTQSIGVACSLEVLLAILLFGLLVLYHLMWASAVQIQNTQVKRRSLKSTQQGDPSCSKYSVCKDNFDRMRLFDTYRRCSHRCSHSNYSIKSLSMIDANGQYLEVSHDD